MYVREIRVEGIKGFEPGARGVRLSLERPDGTYSGWTVIAGRNGAGKSTLLQAIALAVAGPSIARSLRPSFQGWINDSVAEATVGVRIDYSADADRFGVGGFPPGPFWAGLRWSRDPTGESPLKTTEPLVEQYRPSGAKLAAVRGPWFENPRGWFVAGYGPFRRLSKASSEAQRLMLGTRRTIQLATLFREDASLEECVQWLQQVNFQKLEDKPGAAELEATVISLLNDGLLPDGVLVERVDSEGLWVSGLHRSPLPLEEMSDGYRTVAALVADICRLLYDAFGEFRVDEATGETSVQVPYEGVVLIDEIDVHLHVSWQQRIGFWLKEHFPNIQFIVSTHSPYICQAADEGGLIRLPAPGEARNAERIEGSLFKRIVNGSADDATLSELFGLEHTHSLQSEVIRRRVAELEARLIQGRAEEHEQLELLDLLRELPEPAPDMLVRLGHELQQ